MNFAGLKIHLANSKDCLYIPKHEKDSRPSTSTLHRYRGEVLGYYLTIELRF